MITLFKVFMSDTASVAVAKTLNSGYIGEGKKVVEFENAIINVIDNPNVVAVNCCTSAITIALRLAGVGFGDFVLTTPVTCLATNEPILALGAKPIWVDVDEQTGNMSVDDLKDKLMTYEDVAKAILCMHWGGYPCDLEEINSLGQVYDTPVIEDAAHDFGGTYKSRPIGNHSDYVCFSFQAIKHITSVDGGAVVCKDSKDVERAKLMRWYGLDRSKGCRMRCVQDPKEFGYKFHMNDVNATIGLENIKHLSNILNKTRHNAMKYFVELRELDKITLPNHTIDRMSSYWLFTILVDNPSAFIAHMYNNDIECSQVHGRNDKKAMFKSSRIELPGVDMFSSHQVSIPCGWWLEDKDVEHIIDIIKKY